MNEATATKNTAEILRAAAARVRDGWTRMELFSNGKVCALGGVAHAIGLIGAHGLRSRDFEPVYKHPLVIATARVVAGQVSRRPVLVENLTASEALSMVYTWNDADDQTAENVALGLEYAALVWEQEHVAGVQAAGSQSAAAPDGQTCILSERR